MCDFQHLRIWAYVSYKLAWKYNDIFTYAPGCSTSSILVSIVVLASRAFSHQERYLSALLLMLHSPWGNLLPSVVLLIILCFLFRAYIHCWKRRRLGSSTSRPSHPKGRQDSENCGPKRSSLKSSIIGKHSSVKTDLHSLEDNSNVHKYAYQSSRISLEECRLAMIAVHISAKKVRRITVPGQKRYIQLMFSSGNSPWR